MSISRDNTFEIGEKQLVNVYTFLINRSWANSETFLLYQEAWNTIAALMGITSPHNGTEPVLMAATKPAQLCHCEGCDPGCTTCDGKGYTFEISD